MSAVPPGAQSPIMVQGIIVARSLTPIAGSGQQWTPPTVWIEEQHRDLTVITEHPVETGAPVSDHAYNRPSEVTLRLGWNGEDLAEIQSIYAQIISLKTSFTLFDLMTGKRSYINMLVATVAVVTDERSENVLYATIQCRQLILVNTQTTSVAGATSAQAIPQSTANTTNLGATTLTTPSSFNPAGFPTGGTSPLM